MALLADEFKRVLTQGQERALWRADQTGVGRRIAEPPNRGMNWMDIIETSRLLIRPFTMEDLNAVHHILDVDLKWAGRTLTLDERRQRLLYQIGRTSDLANAIYGNRAIILRLTQEIVGMVHFQSRIVSAEEKKAVGLPPEDEAAPFNTLELDLGYAVATQHQRQGYATEAVRAMVEYAFGVLRLGRIFADTMQSNIRSQALMKRLGMTIAPCPRAGWPDRQLACLVNPNASHEIPPK